MKWFLYLFRKHPASTIAYLLYTLLLLLEIKANWQYDLAAKTINHGERFTWGEGLSYGYVFTFFIAIGFLMVSLSNMPFQKRKGNFTPKGFYEKLSLLIPIQFFSFLIIVYILDRILTS